MAMAITMYDPIKGNGEEVDLNDGNPDKPSSSLRHHHDIELGLDGLSFHPNPITDRTTKTSSSWHLRQQGNHPQRRRLMSLDIFRGLMVALMILVDEAGGVLPAINHSPWNGVTLADFVMPFFLFMVGVSLSLAFKRVANKFVSTRKSLLRTLKLFALGVILQGGFFHGINNLTYGVDIGQMRWMGILQRIAIAYVVGAACEIWLKGDDGDDHADSGFSILNKYRFQCYVALLLVAVYISLLYGLYVPDWEYQVPAAAGEAASTLAAPQMTFLVKCGVRGDTRPACNAAGMIDRIVLGIQHLYRKPIYARTRECSINSPDYGHLPPDAPSWCQAPFEPEGLLSSVMAIVTCLVGLHYGHVIVHIKGHRERIIKWTLSSACLMFSGLALSFLGMPVNKALYSLSYMAVTASTAGFLFAGIYMLVDVCGYRRMPWALKWMGMHALTIFVLAASNVLPIFLQGFYWKVPENNLLKLIGIGR